MKKLLLTAMILTAAGAGLVPFRVESTRRQNEARAASLEQQPLVQQLITLRSEQEELDRKVASLEQHAKGLRLTMDPVFVESVLAAGAPNHFKKIGREVVASLGGTDSPDYVLVSKTALADARFKPLEKFPDWDQLTPVARAVLALTPSEEQAIEAAFAETFATLGAWARTHVHREGPDWYMLFCYTIPMDQKFHENITSTLRSSIDSSVGAERGELLWNCFTYARPDRGVGDRPHVFSLHRIDTPPGLAHRSGWRMEDGEAINTYPEPIKPDRFPPAFYHVFPGGWQDLARREGLKLPAEFTPQPTP